MPEEDDAMTHDPEENSSMHSLEERYQKEPVARLMFSMALPQVAAQLVNLLYSIVDRVYIGHIRNVGTASLAGVGLCNTVVILISAFASLVGGGGSPLFSMALGREDADEADRILNSGFHLLVFFSIALMAILYPLMRPLLTLCAGSSVTLPYAVSYLSTYLAGTPAVLFSLGLSPFINAEGAPRFAFLATTTGAVLNIILDPVFLFVFHMGVAGASLATVLSQVVSAVLILYFLIQSPRAVLKLHRTRLFPDPAVVRRMLSLGVSPFVMTATESVIGFVLNGQLAKFGDLYVSALTILQSGMQFVTVPLQGFSQGCIPVLSYQYGHRSPERLKAAFRVLSLVLVTWNAAFFLFFVLCPSPVAHLFTQDPELIAAVCRAAPVFLSGMIIFGLQRASQNTFVATGQAKISLFIAFLRKIFLLVPLAYLLPHFVTPGYNGVFLAESVADATAATICTLLFLNRFPKILQSITD
jgi:putative MATE family efflux protein